MGWPTPSDYDEAAENLCYSMSDEELRGGQAALDDQQLPMVWTGSFASVYRIHCPSTGKTWALKCFTREVSARQERYRHIAAAIDAARLPFMVPFVYLERGVQVHGQWYPAVKMEWVEGQPLNRFVEDSLEKPKMLRQLLDLWPKLAARLGDAGIAHADLQHGNVLLVPAADGRLALKLIDYDGMYVPALAGTHSGEAGHPNYQHPTRLSKGEYNVHVDRFSHLVILSAVYCLLVVKRDLWQRFNNEENLLFREHDFQAPERSELFRVLSETNEPSVRGLVGRLALACKQPLEEVPWLDELVVNGRVRSLTRKEQSQVAESLAVGKTTAALAPPLPLAKNRGEGLVLPSPVGRGAGGKGGGERQAPPLPLGAARSEGGDVPSIVRPPPLPSRMPELVTRDTRPATAEWTVPAVVEAQAPRLVGDQNDRAKASPSVLGWIPFRGLLSRLAGDKNTILHRFLCIIVVAVLCAGLIMGGGLLHRQGKERAARELAAVQQAEADTAAREKAEAYVAAQKKTQAAARRKAAEAERKKTEEEAARKEVDATVRKKAEEEASQKKAQEEAARKKVEEAVSPLVARLQAALGTSDKPTAEGILGKIERMIPRDDPRIATWRRLVEALPEPTIAFDLGNGIKLEMVLIRAGEFLMGSPDSDKDASTTEKPQHRVRITKPFYLGKYPVTQEQWEAVMGNNPSEFKRPKNPVETVSWDDCQQFLDKLNAKWAPEWGKFQLPAEAQWEYACRAGSRTRYYFADDEGQLGDYAWYGENSGDQTHPVGGRKPNAWGLYDMHGNVWEWCQDLYNDRYYAHSPMDDPTGPTTGSDRVSRSGCWSPPARVCRSASRFIFRRGLRFRDLGLRVSLLLAEK